MDQRELDLRIAAALMHSFDMENTPDRALNAWATRQADRLLFEVDQIVSLSIRDLDCPSDDNRTERSPDPERAMGNHCRVPRLRRRDLQPSGPQCRQSGNP